MTLSSGGSGLAVVEHAKYKAVNKADGNEIVGRMTRERGELTGGGLTWGGGGGFVEIRELYSVDGVSNQTAMWTSDITFNSL